MPRHILFPYFRGRLADEHIEIIFPAGLSDMNAGSFQLAMVVPSPDYPDIRFCQQMEQFGKPFFVLKLGAKPHHIGIRSPVYFFPTPDAEMGIDVFQQTSRIQAGYAAPFYIGQAFFFQMLPDIIFRILVHRAAEMVFAGTSMGKVSGNLLRQAGMDVLHLRLFLVGQVGMFEKDHRVGQ